MGVTVMVSRVVSGYCRGEWAGGGKLRLCLACGVWNRVSSSWKLAQSLEYLSINLYVHRVVIALGLLVSICFKKRLIRPVHA